MNDLHLPSLNRPDSGVSVPLGWEIVTHLVRDRFGECFVVELRGSTPRRRAVLRRIHPRLGATPAFERAMRAEARLAAACQHANIARVVGFGSDRAGLYVMIEHFSGLTCGEIIDRLRSRGRALRTELAVEIVTQASLGLRVARSLAGLGNVRGALPSMVLAEEVLIGRDGLVKLLVAGLGSAQLPSWADADAPRRLMTDVASLGLLLFQLLTLHTPSPDIVDSDEALAAFMCRLRPDVAPSVVSACAHSLVRDSRERFTSTVDLVEALASAGAPVLARGRLKVLVPGLGAPRPRPVEAEDSFERAPRDPDTEIQHADAPDEGTDVDIDVDFSSAEASTVRPGRLARGSGGPPTEDTSGSGSWAQEPGIDEAAPTHYAKGNSIKMPRGSPVADTKVATVPHGVAARGDAAAPVMTLRRPDRPSPAPHRLLPHPVLRDVAAENTPAPPPRAAALPGGLPRPSPGRPGGGAGAAPLPPPPGGLLDPSALVWPKGAIGGAPAAAEQVVDTREINGALSRGQHLRPILVGALCGVALGLLLILARG